jgi:hypothetical protein
MVTYIIITEKLTSHPAEYNSFNFKIYNYHFTKQQVYEDSRSTTVSTHYMNKGTAHQRINDAEHISEEFLFRTVKS